MTAYYEPDDRWDLYGITTKEQFEHQFVVKGYFHAQVPEDVVGAFTTVEYLQAHSYYYWPMYDEAFNKALRLLEMAVKQKAKQLCQSLKNKSFDQLINEICKQPYRERLNTDLHRARKIRNNQVHIESNSYSGAIGGKGKNFKLFINVINELFRDEEWLNYNFALQQNAVQKIGPLQNQLLVLETGGTKILIKSIPIWRIVDQSLFLVCVPILQNVRIELEEHRYSPPIALELVSYMFQDSYISGKEGNGMDIRLYINEKDENVLKLENYNDAYISVSLENRAIYEHHMNIEAAWDLVKLEYDFLSRMYK
jgi:hypothetical protein